MHILDNDLDHERAVAVNVAARRYPTFAAYALERQLSARFTADQVEQLRATWEQWHSVVAQAQPVGV